MVYHKDITFSFTVTNDHYLSVTWVDNGTDVEHINLGELMIGDTVILPSVNVTCVANGGYVCWRYYGPDVLRVGCKEVDEGGCVNYVSGYSVVYTFVIQVLAKPIKAGTYNFTISFEKYDELPT